MISWISFKAVKNSWKKYLWKKHAHSRKLLQKNSNKNHIYTKKKAHIYKPKITNILKVTFFSGGTSQTPGNIRPEFFLSLSLSLSLSTPLYLFFVYLILFLLKNLSINLSSENNFFLSINLSADFIFTNLSISWTLFVILNLNNCLTE